MDTKNFARSTSQDLTILMFIILSISTIATCYDEATTTHLPVDHDAQYTTYIQEQCKATPYPAVCLESFSPIALRIAGNEMNLCEDALTDALQAAQNVSKLVGIDKYCSEKINESMVDLNDTIIALNKTKTLNGVDKQFQWTNIQSSMDFVMENYVSCQRIGGEVEKMIMKTSNTKFFLNKLKLSK